MKFSLRRLKQVARCTMKMPEEFLLKISRLGDKTDDVCGRVLNAGAEVVLKKVRTNLRNVISKDTKTQSRSTGELERSLGVSPVLSDKNGNLNIKIGLSEPRTNGESNAKIASVIEYGKSGQPPKPFMKPAKSASRKECMTVMINTLDEEVKSI